MWWNADDDHHKNQVEVFFSIYGPGSQGVILISSRRMKIRGEMHVRDIVCVVLCCIALSVPLRSIELSRSEAEKKSGGKGGGVIWRFY